MFSQLRPLPLQIDNGTMELLDFRPHAPDFGVEFVAPRPVGVLHQIIVAPDGAAEAFFPRKEISEENAEVVVAIERIHRQSSWEKPDDRSMG
jgi:hypothetical protein